MTTIKVNETVTNCNQLKLVADAGRLLKTDVGRVELLLSLIQTISSPKIELLKE